MTLYFLCDRPSATRYHELEPGLANTADVQEQIIDEIRAHRLNYVILREESARKLEGLTYPKGSVLLDRFIRDHFHFIKRFGAYSVWQRKEVVRTEASD
jgi:hypothetical protein